MTPLTQDSISLRGVGVVTVLQPKKGVRFTQDSLLLADFCRVKPHDRVLDPGAGTGIISLLLAKKYPHTHLTAVEMQPAAAELCRRNIAENNLAGRITLLEHDITKLKSALKASTFDVIVANPPYTTFGKGKKSPFPERHAARQDQSAPLHAWLDLQRLLKNKGKYFLIFPVRRLAELMSLLQEKKLEPKRLRLVHPSSDKPASLALVETIKAAGTGLEVLPPLFVHETNGRYAEEMCRIFDLP